MSVDQKEILRRLLVSPDEGKDVLNAVSMYWYLDGLFPVPKFEPSCPICGCRRVIYRLARFFEKGNEEATLKWRCDVGFKCPDCSNTWTHGVVIPASMFKRHGRRTYTRKTILNEIVK